MQRKIRFALCAFSVVVVAGCTIGTASSPDDSSLASTPAQGPSSETPSSLGANASLSPGLHATQENSAFVRRAPSLGTLQPMSAVTPQLPYNGGPIVTGTKHIYIVWYGKWVRSPGGTMDIVEDFAKSIGGSPYFKINETFYDKSKAHATNAVTFVKSVVTGYTKGTTLKVDDVANVVEDQLDEKVFSSDKNGVYFVIGDSAVNVITSTKSLCTDFCGWHTNESYSGLDLKYAYLGSGTRCPSQCEWKTPTPNANAEADALVSSLAHELEETTTDPDVNAWINKKGMENADLCAWQTGDTYNAGGGSANMHLGDRDYLIQMNTINAGSGDCALHVDLARPAAGVGGTRTGDFNGDGYGELLFRDSSTGVVSQWLMFGYEPVQKYTLGTVSNDWEIFGVADMDGDRKADIVWRNTTTNQISIWFMNGPTRASHVESTWSDTNFATGWSLAGLQAMPDGTSRVLMRNLVSGALQGLSLRAGVETIEVIGGGFDLSYRIVGTGDFNHDGLGDILWQQTGQALTEDVVAWMMNGSAILAITDMGVMKPVLGIGDLDGDGNHDLLTLESTGLVRKMVQNGAVVSSAAIAVPTSAFRLEAEVDLNSDGRDDLVFRNRQTGDLVMWYLGVDGSFDSENLIEAGVAQNLEVIRE